MDLTEFLRLKEELEEAKKAQARLYGKRDVLEQRLLDQFRCATRGEAKKLLAKTEKRLAQLERAYQEKYRVFQERYGSALE